MTQSCQPVPVSERIRSTVEELRKIAAVLGTAADMPANLFVKRACVHYRINALP